MSHSIRISTNLRIFSHSPPSSSHESPKLLFSRQSHVSGFKSPSLVAANLVCLSRFRALGTQIISPTARSEGVNFGDLEDSLALVEFGSICSETQFDTVLSEAQRLQEPVIIIWMASWCRKCIYLKPKLEKLAAEYYPRIQFYRVDVNAVPHKLVVRAAVTKMPTIQIWKDGEKQSEVIGGHKAHLVVSEVRAMIEN